MNLKKMFLMLNYVKLGTVVELFVNLKKCNIEVLETIRY